MVQPVLVHAVGAAAPADQQQNAPAEPPGGAARRPSVASGQSANGPFPCLKKAKKKIDKSVDHTRKKLTRTMATSCHQKPRSSERADRVEMVVMQGDGLLPLDPNEIKRLLGLICHYAGHNIDTELERQRRRRWFADRGLTSGANDGGDIPDLVYLLTDKQELTDAESQQVSALLCSIKSDFALVGNQGGVLACEELREYSITDYIPPNSVTDPNFDQPPGSQVFTPTVGQPQFDGLLTQVEFLAHYYLNEYQKEINGLTSGGSPMERLRNSHKRRWYKTKQQQLKRSLQKLMGCYGVIRGRSVAAVATGAAQEPPLTQEERAKLIKYLGGLGSTAGDQGLIKLGQHSDMVKELLTNDWLCQAEIKAQAILWKVQEPLGEIGATQSTTYSLTGGVSGTIPGFENSDLSPEISGSFGLNKSETFSCDDEKLYFKIKSLEATAGVSAGIGKSIAKTAGNEASASWGANVSGNLGLSVASFKEYVNSADYTRRAAYKTQWANISESGTSSPIKKLLWKVPKCLGIGSDLKNLKKQIFKVSCGQGSYEGMQQECTSAEGFAEFAQAKGVPARPVDIVVPSPHKEAVLEGMFWGASVSGAIGATLSSSFGNQEDGLKLGAGGGAKQKFDFLDGYEWIPVNALDMADMEPHRLREIPDKYTRWLRNGLGVRGDKLYIYGVDNEHTEVNANAQKVSDKTTHSVCIREEGNAGYRHPMTTNPELHTKNVLAWLEGEMQHYFAAKNRSEYLGSQSKLTPEQKDEMKQLQRDLKGVYGEFNIIGDKPMHKLFQSWTLGTAFLKNQLTKNPNMQLSDDDRERLERVETMLKNPPTTYSRHYLDTLTSFKYVVKLQYFNSNTTADINIGPLKARANVRAWYGVHPSRLREGSFFDFDIAGGVGTGLQELISGADIGRALDPFLQQQGIADLDLSILPDISLSGEWSLRLRIFKPKYRQSTEYKGDKGYQVQTVRQLTNVSASVGLKVSGIPAGAASASVGASASRSRTTVDKETIGTEDLTYPNLIYNRFYRDYGKQPGSRHWEHFVEDLHKPEFEKIFTNLGDPRHGLWSDIDFFFETELLDPEKSTPEQIRDNQRLYRYMRRVFGAYKTNPTEANFQLCRKGLEGYFLALLPFWWQRHMSTWVPREFQQTGHLSIQEFGSKVTRAFTNKSKL